MSKAKKGKKLSKEHIEKIRQSLIGRPVSKKTRKIIGDKVSETTKGKKNIKVRHHLYGTDYPELLITTRSLHRKIHSKAYWYILNVLGKNEIDKYIKWFFKQEEKN